MPNNRISLSSVLSLPDADGEQKQPNDILLSLLFESLSHLNDCELPLRDEDCRAFTGHVTNRFQSKSNSDKESSPPLNIKFDNLEDSSLPRWRCHAGSSGSRIVMIFVPETMSDLHKISVFRMVDQGQTSAGKLILLLLTLRCKRNKKPSGRIIFT